MRLTPRHYVESSLREIAPVLDAASNLVGHARLIHYVVRTKLVSTADDGSQRVVAEGLGSTSTFELRYLYRWVPAADLPPGADVSKLRSRRRRTRDGEALEYRLIDPDLDGLDNTSRDHARGGEGPLPEKSEACGPSHRRPRGFPTGREAPAGVS
jgi:hypothetical protein